MKHLLHILEGRLATLPVPMAVELPAGQHLGAPDPAVVLRFRDRMALEGGMRDLMAAATGLLTRDPGRDQHHGWWRRVLGRAVHGSTHAGA